MNPTPHSCDLHALNASAHPDPSAFYRELSAEPGLHFDARHQLWVAAHPDTVLEVLRHPELRVSPAAGPVPLALKTGAAGALIGHWMRRVDGPAHRLAKAAISTGLDAWVQAQSLALRSLVHSTSARLLEQGWSPWMWGTASSSMAQLLGIAPAVADHLAGPLHQLAQGLAHPADSAQASLAHGAAQELLDTLSRAAPSPFLQSLLATAAQQGWHDTAAVQANLLALIWQSHEATAALLGSAALTLSRAPQEAEQLRAHPSLCMAFLKQRCRFDAPIQNTRRHVPRDLVLAGTPVPTGACILVVLAAASIGTRPEQPQTLLTFGAGPHACPGQDLALLMAETALQQALHSGIPLPTWPARNSPCFEQAANLRAPVLPSSHEQKAQP